MRKTITAMLLCVGVVAARQSTGILNWNPNGSTITINGPATSGTAFTYALPSRSGTLALVETSSPTPTPPPVPVPSVQPAPLQSPVAGAGTTVTDPTGAVWTFG